MQKGDNAAPASRSFAPSPSPSVVLETGNVDIFKVEVDEYEAKESEQPRAMEFHTSSSSESESDEERDSPKMNGRSVPSSTMFGERPKTAAKELEQYRDAVPEEFFQRIEQEEDDDDYELERNTESVSASSDSAWDTHPTQQPQRLAAESTGNSRSDSRERARPKDRTPAFRVHVPAEVQELFSVRCIAACCRSFRELTSAVDLCCLIVLAGDSS